MEATGLVSLHDNKCRICEYEGHLLCCDMCTQVFHLSCLLPELHDVPEGYWFCQWCLFDHDAIQKMTSERHRTRCQQTQERLVNVEVNVEPPKFVYPPRIYQDGNWVCRWCLFDHVVEVNVEPPKFVYPPDPSEEKLSIEKVDYAREQLRIYKDGNGNLSFDKAIKLISDVIASDELISIEVIYASIELLVNSSIPMVRDCLFRRSEGDEVLLGARGIFIRWFQAASDQIVESTVASKEHIVGVEIIILILKLLMKMDFKSNLEFNRFRCHVDLLLFAKQARNLAKRFQVKRLYKTSCEASTYLDKIPKQRKKQKREVSAPLSTADKSLSDNNLDELVCQSEVCPSIMDPEEQRLKRPKQEISGVDDGDISCISFETQKCP